MSDDIFSSFGRGFVAFAHTRAADLVGSSFSDAGSLVGSLADGQTGTTKTAFDQLKADIDALSAIGTAISEAIKKEIGDGKAAVTEMAAELGKTPFQADELARALTALGKLLVAYDAAITKVADEISKKPGVGVSARQLRDDIAGMHAPIRRLLNNTAGAVTSNFDNLCKFVLNVDNASQGLGDRLEWDYAEKKLKLKIAAAGAGGVDMLKFDGASLEAFFTYKDDFKAGLVIKTKLSAGLRNDAFLQKIIPGQGKTEDSDQAAITLDTKDGLTFGAGKDKRLILPIRFSQPGIELREFAIEQPAQDNASGKNRVNVVFTVAGKLGDVFACVVEGGGISIRWADGAAPVVEPKIPSGAGMRIKAPPVTGGGYLRYDEVKKEYGGVFQLEIAKIGVTAIGLLGTEPFSLVIVIGVRFSPKIELGYGFTLSGLGGILAIERTLDSAALRDGLKSGVVGQLLFPEDPVAAAPGILNQLGKIFPPRAGGFVIGPIAELGWGSQAGFVKARMGIVLSLPDPKLVILGNVQIGIPSADVPEKARVIDLRAEIMGEITLDYLFIKVSLAKSKIFMLDVTGDIALFIGWSGEGAFALSVGGFFPGYEAPPQIGKMDRIGIKFDPGADWLKIAIEAYVAITSNSVQFGGKVSLVATIKPFKAEAWIQIDAMFRWAPHFYFVVRIDAGIRVSAFDVTLVGVTFRGELSGDKPFRIEGKAEVTILFWDIPVDIGPLEWGDRPPVPAPEVDPAEVAAAALTSDEAWTPRLPDDAQHIVRLAPADDEPLYHPLGVIEARQISVPLEMDLDRIGSGKVTRKRINLANARLNGTAAGAVWPLKDRFAPGHFLSLTDQQVLSRPAYEERASGLGMGASRGAAFPTAVHAAMAWETFFPGDPTATQRGQRWRFDKIASRVLTGSAKGLRARANAWIDAPPRGETVVLEERGMVRLVSADTLRLTATEGAGLVLPASEAVALARAAEVRGISLTTLAAGFV